MKLLPSHCGAFRPMNSEREGRTTSPIVPLRSALTCPQITHCAVSGLLMPFYNGKPPPLSMVARALAQNDRAGCRTAVIIEGEELIDAGCRFPAQDFVRVAGAEKSLVGE